MRLNVHGYVMYYFLFPVLVVTAGVLALDMMAREDASRRLCAPDRFVDWTREATTVCQRPDGVLYVAPEDASASGATQDAETTK